MNTKFIRIVQWYVLLADVLIINAVLFALQYFFLQTHAITSSVEYQYFSLLFSITWLFVFLVEYGYGYKQSFSFEQMMQTVLRRSSYFLLIFLAALFFLRLLDLSRLFILISLPVVLAAVFFNHLLFVVLFRRLQSSSAMTRNVLVIGHNKLSGRLIQSIEKESLGKNIIGVCEDVENVRELTPYPVLSNVNDAIDICRQYNVNEIYSTIAPEHNSNLYSIMQKADQHCIRFKMVPDLGYFVNRKMYLNYVGDMPVMALREEPLEDTGNRAKKRIFDVVVSLLVIILVLSWLVPILALLIFIESRGPIFFAQQRSGRDNKSFTCYKFRSMYVNGASDSKQASRNDDRITRIGRFLRKTSLDEFPQFFNVLKGDMSIVGPRPHMLKHTDEYSLLIEQYMVRQFLKPGITGWAQVNGFRGETINVELMEKRVEYDLHYLENWSLFLDTKIIFLTAYNIVAGEKNAF